MRLGIAIVALFLCGGAAADTRNLPVPNVTLYPGDAINTQGLSLKVFSGNPSIWANYVLDAEALAGKEARRTLVAGQPIALAAIKTPDVVKRGVATRAVLRSGGLEITTLLTPLASGAAGEVVEARNIESGITVPATVMADGSLLVSTP